LSLTIFHFIFPATQMKINTLIKLFITILIVFSCFELSAKPGDLDSSFGENGIVRTYVEINFNNQTSSIILENGNIIVASEFEYPYDSRGVQLLCYKPDGSLNYDFGNLGRVKTVCGIWNDYDFRYNDPITLKLQDNKKIIAAGLSVSGNPDPTSSNMLLIRYNLDGSIDPSFGSGGSSKHNLTKRCNEILNIELQSDGKIVAIAATDTTTNGCLFSGLKKILMRFTKDGTLDSAFGKNGIVDIDKIHIDEYKQPIVILNDNSIIIGGSIKVDVLNDYYDYAICKYDKNGNLDLNFGQEGFTSIHFSEYRRWESSNIFLFEDNKLLISDRYYSFPPTFMGIAIIKTNGELLEDFGLNGKLFIQLPNDYVVKNVMLLKNKLITCGMIWDTALITRIGWDGVTDSSFGNDGYTYIPQYQAINVHIYNNNLITTGSFYTPPSSFVMAKLALDNGTYVDNDIIENSDLLIYPNPVKESTKISIFKELHGLLSIRLYDINGVLVQESRQYSALNEYPLRLEFRRDGLLRSGRYLMVISNQLYLISSFIEID
jgi:uncharacterized delta-60 repeat protein